MPKNIQKAIVYPNFKYKVIEKIKDYDIVYLGSEFCANLIPSEKDIQTVVDKGYKKIVIFIPFLNEKRFEDYLKLINICVKKFKKFIEISTSDLGIINILNNKYPYIHKNISRPLSIEFVRMKDDILKKNLIELKINAIETDESIFIEKLKKINVKVHFHTNFAFVAAQRHCPFITKITDNCNHPCIFKETILHIPQSKYKIYSRNNVYLKKEKKTIENVDRIIHWP